VYEAASSGVRVVSARRFTNQRFPTPTSIW
jgi:hypothetical protein